MNEQPDIDRFIAGGENATVEFKSSFRTDVSSGSVNKELSKVVAKTIAGFLNREGGTLLIGVADDRHIVGIEADIASLTRNDVDGFEQTLRMTLGNHLGVEVSPSIDTTFHSRGGLTVACVRCAKWHQPIFFDNDGKREFYVRDGNLTRPLDIKASHDYIGRHWRSEPSIDRSEVRALVEEALRERGLVPAAQDQEGATSDARNKIRHRDSGSEPGSAPQENATPSAVTEEITRSIETAASGDSEVTPPWLRVSTRRVLNLFLHQLVSTTGWKRVHIVSPWISDIAEGAAISFDSLLRRFIEDSTTVYVVTRPPEETWHKLAVDRLAKTKRANIVFVQDLHIKLYVAATSQGEFAMLGSANFTQNSFLNREIGLLVNAYSDGRSVVRDLDMEARDIYRTPGRELVHRAEFRIR